MKTLLLAALILGASPLALSQTASAKAAHASESSSASRAELRGKANQIAAGVVAADHALTPEEMAIADQIHVGRLPCELGSYVQVDADPKSPGFFRVSTKTAKFRMFPVVTSTGAIRLEDRKSGAVWLQLANKSMLMNQKLGQRLADECMSPAQHAVAEALKANPAPSFMDSAPATVANKAK